MTINKSTMNEDVFPIIHFPGVVTVSLPIRPNLVARSLVTVVKTEFRTEAPGCVEGMEIGE